MQQQTAQAVERERKERMDAVAELRAEPVGAGVKDHRYDLLGAVDADSGA